MQIPPGDSFLHIDSGSFAQPRPAARQVPAPQSPPQQQATTTPPGDRPAEVPNSPPPVDRAHSIEKIASGTVPRNVPCGSLIDIRV